MKFFATAAIVVASLIAFSLPATAASKPTPGWSGFFDSVTRDGDAYRTEVTLHATGELKVERYGECRQNGGRWECKDPLGVVTNGNTQQVSTTTHSNGGGNKACRNTATTTCYAIFRDGMNNVRNTAGREYLIDECRAMRGCTTVQAPFGDWHAAVAIADRRYPNWNLL